MRPLLGSNVVIIIKTRSRERSEKFFEKIKIPPIQVFLEYRILKVKLLGFHVRCGFLISNQCKECECVIEFSIESFERPHTRPFEIS